MGDRSRVTEDLLRRAQKAASPAERERLLDEVVLLNLEVAESIARRYRDRGIDAEDLSQVACEALVKAVHRFDSGREKDLLSYAVPTIRGEVLRCFRDQGWLVRPTRSVQENQWRITRARDRLYQELGRPPSREDVIHDLGITPEEYDAAAAAVGCFQPTSLDQPTGPEVDTSLGDLLPDPTADDYEAVDSRVMLEPVLRRLSSRDRRILFLRYWENRTQEEIGAQVGVTQTQVSRRLSGILSELREQLD